MQTTITAEMLLTGWWVLTNGFLYYAEADFLLRFWESRSRTFIPIYALTNIVLTVIAIRVQMLFAFNLLQVVLVFLFLRSFFKVPPKRAITPAVIIYMLSTFNEGFATVFMRYLASTIKSEKWGMFFQFALPAISVGLLFLALRLIVRKYPLMNQSFISSYLYILLFPSVLIIAGIRISLGLDFDDGKFGHGAVISGDSTFALFAMFGIIGALLIFFLILAAFHKIIVLSQQEMQHALLAGALKEQQSYIDEARQRNEGYRSFQHDINNHLLVLSGLLHKESYRQAKRYLQKLNATASGLSEQISTGNSVLDILLWEKIRYAKQYGIAVTCDVQIPKACVMDDIDLCILFANAIDNAIAACIHAQPPHKTITLTAKPKHSFLLIHVVNGIDCPKPFRYGTGLKNMELTANKYAGTIHTEQAAHRFSLSILLCCNHAAEDAPSPTDTPLA